MRSCTGCYDVTFIVWRYELPSDVIVWRYSKAVCGKRHSHLCNVLFHVSSITACNVIWYSTYCDRMCIKMIYTASYLCSCRAVTSHDMISHNMLWSSCTSHIEMDLNASLVGLVWLSIPWFQGSSCVPGPSSIWTHPYTRQLTDRTVFSFHYGQLIVVYRGESRFNMDLE